MKYERSNKLPEWLTRKMKEQNMGVIELAHEIGVWPQTISDLLNGKEPSFDIAVALARVFNEVPESILRMGGVLSPVSESEYFRGMLVKETADMSSEELDDLLAYVNMIKRAKNLDGARPKNLSRI
jgi:transcriptional regulator with XRE-family HTH domain